MQNFTSLSYATLILINMSLSCLGTDKFTFSKWDSDEEDYPSAPRYNLNIVDDYKEEVPYQYNDSYAEDVEFGLKVSNSTDTPNIGGHNLPEYLISERSLRKDAPLRDMFLKDPNSKANFFATFERMTFNSINSISDDLKRGLNPNNVYSENMKMIDQNLDLGVLSQQHKYFIQYYLDMILEMLFDEFHNEKHKNYRDMKHICNQVIIITENARTGFHQKGTSTIIPYIVEKYILKTVSTIFDTNANQPQPFDINLLITNHINKFNFFNKFSKDIKESRIYLLHQLNEQIPVNNIVETHVMNQFNQLSTRKEQSQYLTDWEENHKLSVKYFGILLDTTKENSQFFNGLIQGNNVIKIDRDFIKTKLTNYLTNQFAYLSDRYKNDRGVGTKTKEYLKDYLGSYMPLSDYIANSSQTKRVYKELIQHAVDKWGVYLNAEEVFAYSTACQLNFDIVDKETEKYLSDKFDTVKNIASTGNTVLTSTIVGIGTIAYAASDYIPNPLSYWWGSSEKK